MMTWILIDHDVFVDALAKQLWWKLARYYVFSLGVSKMRLGSRMLSLVWLSLSCPVLYITQSHHVT